MRLTRSGRENGPSCSPLMAICHSRTAGPPGAAGGGAAAACERVGDRAPAAEAADDAAKAATDEAIPAGAGPGAEIDSRTSITFSQVLQRILRIFCLTFSSAIE